jgi:hypothetical protein
MIKYRSPAAVEQETLERAKANEPQPTIVPLLSGYINKCWQAAKLAKQPIEQQMLRNMRMDNGVYEPDTLAAIRQMGGSEVYVLLASTKCRAAEAWINDILRPVGERPWTVAPTPVPQLPPDMQAALEQETREVFQEVLAQAQAVNQQLHMADLKEEIRKYAEEEYDKAKLNVMEEAKLRCRRMGDKIDDQLTEGGWHDAWWAVVSDFVRLKAGIVKGPVIRVQKSDEWIQGPQGWTVSGEKVKRPTYDRVSPFDLYPAPDSRGVDDGYLIERHQLSRKDLVELIGVPGYSEESIRKIISEYGIGGKREQLETDPIRAMFDFGTTNAMYFSDKIDVLEFWGSVPGKMLIEWGMPGQIDAEMEYEINAFMAGPYVFRAILNPDKLGRKPYSVDSYQRVPGSFWGKGVPELMADVQDVCNSVARAIVNNAALASGPIVEMNTDRCTDNEDLYPWKIFQSTNSQMLEAPAVRFYQPTIITGPLLQVFEFFSTMAEDQTGIPRWAYGNTSQSGAGSTSSGLSMLMTSASRNVKEGISHLDRMTEGVISRTYDYNMMYDKDDSLKGDAKCVARGVSSYLAKEQKMMRLNEALAQTNNPTDLQIVGVEGRAKMLKAVFRELAPEMDIVPDEEKLKSLVAKIEKEQAQRLMELKQQNGTSPSGGSVPGSGITPQKAPAEMDNAGNPAGGTDTNTFPMAQGVRP